MSEKETPFTRLKERARRIRKLVPRQELGALIRVGVLSLMDQHISPSEWEALEDAFGRLRTAWQEAKEIEETSP
jgi:hypothetical protein